MNFSRRDFIKTASTALCAAMVSPSCRHGSTRSPGKNPPNVVLIFCDDLGYGDIGCFGSPINRTPRIDSLAAEGMRLTDFYSTSGVCTPSRASLMTGCYPRRVNLHRDEAGDWVLFPVARKGLHPDEITLASLLKGAGYATAAVGKWHLGDQPEFLPTRHGFDEYFGLPYSNDMGSEQRPVNPPLPLLRNETVIEAPADQDSLTRRYTEECIRFIRNNRRRPFFLYLAHTMPHVPLAASPEFRGRSGNGPYGDAVEEIDWSTGRILDALREAGLEESTLVVFTSDNGATRRGRNEPLRGRKGQTLEGGMRVPCVVRWPGRIPPGTKCPEVVTTMDWLPTLGKLAGVSLPGDRPIDGMDIYPLLSGEPGAKSPHEAFYYYFMGQLQAVRSGRWKLHLPLKARRHGWRGEPYESKAELYDLTADIGETDNLVRKYPEVTARLTALAEKARMELGDDGRPGTGQRPAGWVETSHPLLRAGESALGDESPGR